MLNYTYRTYSHCDICEWSIGSWYNAGRSKKRERKKKRERVNVKKECATMVNDQRLKILEICEVRVD